VAIGVAGIGAVMVLSKTAAPAAPPAKPPAGVALVGTNANGTTTYSGMQPGYYLFNVLSTASPLAGLSSAGFGQIQLQQDPYQTNNWLVSAYWTGPATTLTDGGPGSWEINNGAGLPDFLGAVTPPLPQPYSNLSLNQWYKFSIRTSFLQSAANAVSVIQNLLAQEGWAAGALVTAAADPSSTPDTWNVAAQWTGAASETSDAPPLWVFVSQPAPAGTTSPGQPANTMP
jgi:hypothetical protein